MIRKIVSIDQEKCNGCGACAEACHESAIAMVHGKARLIRDDYCDGLGDCLPECPTGAITIEEREAADYDAEAVEMHLKAHQQAEEAKAKHLRKTGGCPGSAARTFDRSEDDGSAAPTGCRSRLSQWPVQIKLLPPKASFYDGKKLLIAADCTAYAYANFHEDFIKNHVTVVGCPKLDAVDYSEKLTAIISENDIKEVTIVRMDVPCCGGLEMAAKKALQASGKFIPWQVVTISRDGRILD